MKGRRHSSSPLPSASPWVKLWHIERVHLQALHCGGQQIHNVNHWLDRLCRANEAYICESEGGRGGPFSPPPLLHAQCEWVPMVHVPVVHHAYPPMIPVMKNALHSATEEAVNEWVTDAVVQAVAFEKHPEGIVKWQALAAALRNKGADYQGDTAGLWAGIKNKVFLSDSYNLDLEQEGLSVVWHVLVG